MTHDYGFAFGLIFFGMECVVIGYLIVRSEYLPRTLGLMMRIAGVCYVINSFAVVLYPPFGSTLFPFILLPPFVAATPQLFRLSHRAHGALRMPVDARAGNRIWFSY